MESISVGSVDHGGLGALPLLPNPRAPAEGGRSVPSAPEVSQSGSPVDSSPANPTSATVSQEAVQPVDRALLEETTRDLNNLLSAGRGIRFKLNPEGRGFVVQVVDLETDEVIRSIPPEQILSLRDHFEEVRGLLLDDHA
ncbi:MAG: flagellar protein FlaG [Planctomycetota bacterium]